MTSKRMQKRLGKEWRKTIPAKKLQYYHFGMTTYAEKVFAKWNKSHDDQRLDVQMTTRAPSKEEAYRRFNKFHFVERWAARTTILEFISCSGEDGSNTDRTNPIPEGDDSVYVYLSYGNFLFKAKGSTYEGGLLGG